MNQIAIPKKTISKELSTQINISNEQIYTTGKTAKKYKKQITETVDKMEDYMVKETENERIAVEQALQNLYKKMDKVKEDTTYKTFQQELNYLENKLEITMGTVFEHYSRAIKKIYKAYPDVNERNRKLQEFHNAIADAFLTKDEKKILSLMKKKVKEIPHNVVNIPLLSQ